VRELGGPVDRSSVRLLLTRDDPKQRRLADAVLSDETERLGRVRDQVDTVEDHPVPVRLGDVAGDER
jgi:hypothetical protein